MVKKILGLILLVLSAMVLIVSCSSGKSSPSTKPVVQQEITVTKVGVTEFLIKHPELGEKTKVENMPDWANGPRQKITTTKGMFLFYMAGNEVVTVKQYNANGQPEFEIYRK